MADTQTSRDFVGPWICVAIIILGCIAAAILFIARDWLAFGVSVAVVLIAGAASLPLGILQDTR